MDESRSIFDESKDDNQFNRRELIDFSSINCKNNLTAKGLFKSVKFCISRCIADGSHKNLLNDKKSSHFTNGHLSNSKSSISGEELMEEDEFDHVMKKSYSCSGCHNGAVLMNIITFFAILTMKSIEFQLILMKSFFTIPIWLSYFSLMFLMFPVHTLIRVRGYLLKMLWKTWTGSCSSVATFASDQFNAKGSSAKLATRLCRALFWSIYVGTVLLGLFVLGFVIGGLVTRRVVEEPIQIRENLNFDYTKPSPVVLVPVTSGFMESVKPVSSRFIPYNRKFHLTLSLTLPESDYNRKLGVFQVRMELLSVNGRVTATSTYPSMLRFKSQPIRIMESSLNIVQLITGFQSESQILDIKMKDFIEGHEPTACFKLTLEQRAELQSGAGIPEIYGASLGLESELPMLKKLIWNWRRTVFVWVSIMTFLIELVFVLAFFRSFIVRRSSPKSI